MRVAFTGTHSTGKTSVANEIVGHPEWAHFSIVDNAARTVLGEGYNNRTGVESEAKLAQMMILQQQMELERLAGRYFISARSALDPLAYTQDLYEQGKWDDYFLELYASAVFQHMKEYDVIFYFPITFDLKGDGVRPEGVDTQRRIDEIIFSYLAPYPYYTVPCGTPAERARYVRRVLGSRDRSGQDGWPGYHAPERKVYA